jgi:hypothetical protein
MGNLTNQVPRKFKRQQGSLIGATDGLWGVAAPIDSHLQRTYEVFTRLDRFILLGFSSILRLLVVSIVIGRMTTLSASFLQEKRLNVKRRPMK